jgi:hypothetical protein
MPHHRLGLLVVRPSHRKGKKLEALFSDGTSTHFGARGFQDFTQHRDEARKASYIARHGALEDWTDPRSAGTLSRFILWNKPTLSASIQDFRRRFGV